MDCIEQGQRSKAPLRVPTPEPETLIKRHQQRSELRQNRAPPRVQEAPKRITTPSSPSGALCEFLQQSSETPTMPMTSTRTPTPSSPRVKVPTPVRQSFPSVERNSPVGRAIAHRTRAAQAAATKFLQGPASNTRSQSNNALERSLNAASFLDNNSVKPRRLAS